MADQSFPLFPPTEVQAVKKAIGSPTAWQALSPQERVRKVWTASPSFQKWPTQQQRDFTDALSQRYAKRGVAVPAAPNTAPEPTWFEKAEGEVEKLYGEAKQALTPKAAPKPSDGQKLYDEAMVRADKGNQEYNEKFRKAGKPVPGEITPPAKVAVTAQPAPQAATPKKQKPPDLWNQVLEQRFAKDTAKKVTIPSVIEAPKPLSAEKQALVGAAAEPFVELPGEEKKPAPLKPTRVLHQLFPNVVPDVDQEQVADFIWGNIPPEEVAERMRLPNYFSAESGLAAKGYDAPQYVHEALAALPAIVSTAAAWYSPAMDALEAASFGTGAAFRAVGKAQRETSGLFEDARTAEQAFNEAHSKALEANRIGDMEERGRQLERAKSFAKIVNEDYAKAFASVPKYHEARKFAAAVTALNAGIGAPMSINQAAQGIKDLKEGKKSEAALGFMAAIGIALMAGRGFMEAAKLLPPDFHGLPPRIDFGPPGGGLPSDAPTPAGEMLGLPPADLGIPTPPPEPVATQEGPLAPPERAERRASGKEQEQTRFEIEDEIRTLQGLWPKLSREDARQAVLDSRKEAEGEKPAAAKPTPPPEPQASGKSPTAGGAEPTPPPAPLAEKLEAAPEPSAVTAQPPVLAGITPDPTGHRVVTEPDAFIASLKAGAPQPYTGTLAFPVSALTLVPEEMQFRSAEGKLLWGIKQGKISTWEPNYSGALDVWFDPGEGKVKVVNGHHRTEAALELGIDSTNVHFIEAADAKDARTQGALINLAEGNALPFDAAIFFRDTGETAEDLVKRGIPLEKDVIRGGLALARLSPDLFEKVRIGKENGGMTERTGIAIGSADLSPDAQHDLYKLVQDQEKRGKRLSSEEIKSLAERRIKGAGETVTTTPNLFGEEVIKQSNAIEAARLEVAIKKQLGTDKRLFGYLSKEFRAKALERGKNVISVSENQKIAQQAKEILDVFNRLLYKTGPVEDALQDGAARIARGEDFDAVRDRTYARISESVQEALASGERPPQPTGEAGAGVAQAPPSGAGGVLGQQPAAPPDRGGGAPNVPVRGQEPRGPGTGNVVPAERGVAGAAEPGGSPSAGGLVSEPEPGKGPVDPPKYAEKNKLVTRDRAEQFREIIRRKMNQPKVGVDPEMVAAMSGLALYHFEAGARTFGAWSAKMVDELGDWIQPNLQRLWSFVSHRVATSEALANVKPATMHVPLDERPPVREASEWSLALDEGNIQSTAPAPKVKISDETASKLIYYGQKELVELTLSALTRPASENPGFVLASSTGSGKSYMGNAVLAELKPNLALILTTNQGLITKTIDVGRQFGLDIQRLPPATKGIPPQGMYIATYSGAIGYPGLDSHPWNFLLADESGEARRWWASKKGALVRNLSQKADRSLFMSATPFHTPVELGYADNLGVWKKGGFEDWVSQFGVYQDENGNWVAPANPKRFAKLRLQMTDAGVFVNLTPNLDGYTASFGVVPMTPEHRAGVGNIKRAFDMAALYFQNKGRIQMVRAARAGVSVYTKAFLERSRLPAAIELAKQGRAKGWSVGIFTETRSGRDEIHDFLKDADDATHGQISKLLPPLPDVIKTLRDAFGSDFANFSGSYSEMRQEELAAFNKGEKPVMASTYAAGGMGVDMDDKSGVRPRLAIFLGPPWSGVMFDQAMGRFWRFGTKSDVFAVFLTSDSKAEFSLVHGKVIPRLASLRALIKGVHSDEFVKSFRNIESALAYSQGDGESVDAGDFAVKVESNSVNHYNRIEIPDAKEAYNKGLQIARIDDVKTETQEFGKENTVFTEAKKKAADENVTDHMNELRGGIDPSMIKDILYIGGYYAEGGLREFGRWSTAMVSKFGDDVREYLPDVWQLVNDRLERLGKKAKKAKVKEEEPALPGFEGVLQEQKVAAGAEVGRKLTEKFNEGPMSIDMGAGKIEGSPLFRGTAAAPQAEMFAPAPAPSPAGESEPAPPPIAVTAQMPETRESLAAYKDLEKKIQAGQGDADTVMVAAARAKGAGLRKEAFALSMYRAKVTKAAIAKAVKATWEAEHTETPDAELKFDTRRAHPAPEPLGGLGSAVENMKASTERMKNEPGAKLENLKAAVEGLPTPESMRQRSFIWALAKLDEAVRSGSAEDIEFYLDKAKERGRRVLPPMSEKEIQGHIDQAMKAPGPGPGGKTAGPPEVEGTATQQLTGAIKSAHEKVKGAKLPDTGMPDPPKVEGDSSASQAIRDVGGLVTAAWKRYSEAAPSGEFMDILGYFDGALRRNTFALQKLFKAGMKAVLDETRWQAMTDWLWAEGDPETITSRAALSKGQLKKAYETALTLTDAEKTDVRNFQNAFESYWDVGHEAGVLEGHLENYVPQIWKNNRRVARQIMAQITGGILRRDFKFAKQRTVNGYFEGEQKGMTPLNKNLLFLYTTYVRSLIKAIEGRALVRNLLFNYAKDGKPLAVVSGGKYEVVSKNGVRRLVVSPNLSPKEAVDEEGNHYLSIDHPALREGLYIGKDAKGLPMYLQAPIVVHPSIHKHLTNILSRSTFRDPNASWLWQAGGKIIDYAVTLKQSKLGPISTFHQAQLASQAHAFWVNPFKVNDVDLSDPKVIRLTNGGMTIAEPDAVIQAEEGLVAGGLWDKAPVIGKKARAYKDYLFQDYLPRLKVKTGLKVLEANEKRYAGKYTQAQIDRLTAAQMNDAFGGQNYIMLGRNKTFQDVMRLLLFSPDFTESRARFILGAAKPGNRAKLTALAWGAAQLVLYTYVGAKVIKAITGMDVEWAPPFGIRVGKYEFSMRNAAVDLQRAVDNPRAFMRSRLGPAVAGPAWEAATGVDWRGMPRKFGEQVHDYLYGNMPIWSSGLTDPERHAWESVANALGVEAKKFYSPAGKLALQIHQEDMAGRSRRHETPEMVKDRQEVSKLFQRLNDGEAIPPEKIDEMGQAGTIAPYTAMRLREAKPGDDPLLSLFASLGIQDKMDVWEKANHEERSKLIGEFVLTRRDQRELRALPPAEMDKVIDRYNAMREKAQVQEEEPQLAPEPTAEPATPQYPPAMTNAPREAPQPTMQ